MPPEDPQGACHGCGGEAVRDGLCGPCLDKVGREDALGSQDDNLCSDCDSTGEVGGRMCRSCRGKGYVTP
jgi:hypothetical protein